MLSTVVTVPTTMYVALILDPPHPFSFEFSCALYLLTLDYMLPFVALIVLIAQSCVQWLQFITRLTLAHLSGLTTGLAFWLHITNWAYSPLLLATPSFQVALYLVQYVTLRLLSTQFPPWMNFSIPMLMAAFGC